MKKVLATLALVLGLSSPAQAFLVLPESGNYTLKCQASDFVAGSLTGTSHLAFVRIDGGTEVELAKGPVDANGKFVSVVSVPVTPGQDAEIVCFAFDLSNNRSTRSVDSAILDFTPPAAPTMEP